MMFQIKLLMYITITIHHMKQCHKHYLEDCRNELNATLEEVHGLKRHLIPATRGEACLLACVLKKSGAFDNNNMLDMNKIRVASQQLMVKHPQHYNKMLHVVEQCKQIEHAEVDECTAATHFAQCFFPKLMNAYLLPQMRHNVTECQQQTAATDIEIFNIEIGLPPKTREASCMLACLEKKMGVMNEDNTLNEKMVQNIIMQMNMRNVPRYLEKVKMLNDCIRETDIEGKDECVVAKDYSECFYLKKQKLERPVYTKKRNNNASE